jgi:hypothetical protein
VCPATIGTSLGSSGLVDVTVERPHDPVRPLGDRGTIPLARLEVDQRQQATSAPLAHRGVDPAPMWVCRTLVDDRKVPGRVAPMRVTKATVIRSCAVCERTLLQGEYAMRFSPDGVEFVDVCPLCQEVALEYGWVREGGPMSPVLSPHGRRKRPRWAQLLGVGNGEAQPVVPEPILRRLSDGEAALVEAADLFNASLFTRTVQGVARALGAPLVSIVPLSGVNSELVLTFAWEITWYQYRVLPEAPQPIRLADRGSDIAEIEAAFTGWNAQLDENGRVIPDVAR